MYVLLLPPLSSYIRFLWEYFPPLLFILTQNFGFKIFSIVSNFLRFNRSLIPNTFNHLPSIIFLQKKIQTAVESHDILYFIKENILVAKRTLVHTMVNSWNELNIKDSFWQQEYHYHSRQIYFIEFVSFCPSRPSVSFFLNLLFVVSISSVFLISSKDENQMQKKKTRIHITKRIMKKYYTQKIRT